MSKTNTKNWRKVKLGEVKLRPISFFIEEPLGGDWGKGKPEEEFNYEVYAIRGTDFPILKSGVKVGLPVRYIKKSSIEKRQLRAGDILIEISGGSQGQPVGRPFLVTENMIKNADKPLIYSNFCRRLRTKKKFYARYLYFQLLRIYHSPEIYSYQTQSTGISNFHFTDFINYKEIPVFSPNEQKRIAGILSAFDEKIEVNNKISQTLEEMAAAIFKEWFIGNAKFKNQNAKLGEIAEIIKGKKPQRIYNNSRGEDVEYLLIESFITNNRFFTDDDRVPQSEDGDTVVVMDGASSGRIFRGRKGAVGSTLAVIKPKPVVGREFLFLLLKRAESQLMDNLTGSAIPHLDKDFLKTYPVSVPTSETMEKFTSIVRPILQKMVAAESENQKLAALRDLLLPKLMNGEVRVKA